MSDKTATVTETATNAPLSTIAGIGAHEGQTVTLHGWLYNLRESGKLLFPIFRDGSGTIQGIVPKAAVTPEVFETIKGLTQESCVIVTGKVRADKRAPGGYELDVEQCRSHAARPRRRPLPHLAQGTWRRLPDGAPPSVGAHPAPGGYPAHSRRDHQGRARLPRRQRLHPHRSAHPHAGGLRRHQHAVSRGILRRGSLPHAERATLHRKHRAWRWARSIPSVPRFAPKNRRPAATSPSSGWSSRRWPSPTWTTSWAWRKTSSASSSPGCSPSGAAELKTIGRDTTKLEAVQAALPAHRYDEAVKMLNEAHAKGLIEQNFEYGNDFGSPDETYISSQFDRPVMVHRYPAAVKAFYMEPDPRRPEVRALRRRARARRLRRDHWRLAAHSLLRTAEEAHRGAPVAESRLSSGIWICAGTVGSARGLRHGHRARGGLDLRPGARARNHPLRPHAEPDLSVSTCSCQDPASDLRHVSRRTPVAAILRRRRRLFHRATSASSAYPSISASRAAAWTWVLRPCASPGSKPRLEALGHEVDRRRQHRRRDCRNQIRRPSAAPATSRRSPTPAPARPSMVLKRSTKA